MDIRFRLSLALCGLVAVPVSACSTDLSTRLLETVASARAADGSIVVQGDSGRQRDEADSGRHVVGRDSGRHVVGRDSGRHVVGRDSADAAFGGAGGRSVGDGGELDPTGGSSNVGRDGGSPAAAGAPGLVTCLAGTYAIEHPGSGVVQCSPCPSGTFSVDADADGCRSWTDCMPGTYVVKSGSTSSNRVCEVCQEGELSDEVNAVSCSSSVQCQPGTAMALQVLGAGGSCEPCPSGTFCPGGAVERTECAVGSWDDDGDAATPCKPWKNCEMGSRVLEDGTNAEDRRCTPCTSGFSDQLNAGSCTPWRVCSQGEHILVSGLPDANQVCEPCAEGTFAAVENEELCAEHRVCPMPSFYRLREGTPQEDAECRPCPRRWSSSVDSAGSCDVPPPAFQMVNDELVMEAEAYREAISNDAVDPWVKVEDGGGSGGFVMTTSSDVMFESFTDPQNAGPGLEFDVNFTSAGEFYLHIRGDSRGGGSNSCWASIDGELLEDFGFPEAPGVWSWVSHPFTLEEAGYVVVGLWLREDGFKIDRLVINKSSSAPGGVGPSLDSPVE